MNIIGIIPLYQGNGGISRGQLVVLHGVSNPIFRFLPAIPPNTSKGESSRIHMRRTKIVPSDFAAFVLCILAMALRKQNIRNRGPENRNSVMIRFFTC